MSLTPYIVLRRGKLADDETWIPHGAAVEARSAAEAIRACLESDGGERTVGGTFGATYGAIPARRWKPLRVRVETQQRVVFGGDEG